MKLVKNIFIAFALFIVLCCGLVWLLSPWLVRTLAAEALAEHNVVLDTNSKVRLNLFNSSLIINDLALRKNDQTPYELDQMQLHYSLWRILRKEVHIERVYIRGMQLQVVKQSEQLTIAGFDLGADRGNPALEVEADAKSSDSKDGEPSLIDTLTFLAPDVVFEDIQINLTNEGIAHSILVHKLGLKGTNYQNQVLGSTLDVSAELDDAKITLDAVVEAKPGDTALSIGLNIEGFSSGAYQYLLPEDIVKLQAVVDLALNMKLALKAEQLTVNAGSLNLDVSQFELQETTYQALLGSFDLAIPELDVEFNLDSSALAAKAAVKLDVSALRVGLAQSPTILASLAQLSSDDINVSVNDTNYRVTSESLGLEGLVVSKVKEQLPALLTMQSIKLSTMEFTPELMGIGSITLGAAQSHVKIDESGTLVTLVAMGGEKTAEAQPQAELAGADKTNKQALEPVSANNPKSSQEAGPRIQLGKLSLAEPFNIAISDKSNSYSFSKNFVVTDVRVGKLDSAQTGNKTDFLVKIKDEEYFSGELVGWVTPFTDKLNLDLEAKLREFTLHEVAPYLKDSLGFEVKAGQLDLDFKGHVKEDALDSKSTIVMRGTEFGASEKVDEANLIGQSAIPLNVALGMLKDGDGNIKLKVPIKGDVNDPSFGVHHIVGLIVKKVAVSQAKKQLMNMFIPYAQVVSVAISAGSYALKVRFENLPYLAGQIEVSETQEQFIQQMTALMQDKKDVQVRVCPVATIGDLGVSVSGPISTEQRTQLLELAQKRAIAFKARLVGDGAVESARLLLCSPTVDKKEAALPRLEFGT